jgi:anti-sigma regulatory factor (Ser/Thr protein kinase)
MKKELQFKIKSKIEDLEQMNFTVQGFLEACDIIDQTIFKVNLILEELITNIIKYGFECQKEKKDISIYLSLKIKDKIYIRIEDIGREFNPLYAPVPKMDLPIEDMQIGGLGIHLVKNIISDIDYQRIDDMNVQQVWLKRG